jgi:hypothetical protein
VSGASAPVTADLTVSPTPAGDAARGKTKYGADCSICHGQTADGTPPNGDGTFTIFGAPYPFPAPGLNNAPGSGNLANDPDWNAASFAIAARSDTDNAGVALRLPMPSWLTFGDTDTKAPPTTQDFADIYAYLVSETQ